jgi:hypothetical protein
MGYYISSMIGIRIGGVFSEELDYDNLKNRVSKIILEMRDTDNPDINDDPSHCMSQELRAHKGSYVVIAGVFNYWNYDSVCKFSSRLSKEFGTEVMQMTWDEEVDDIKCNVFLDGKPLSDVNENPFSRAIRHIT